MNIFSISASLLFTELFIAFLLLTANAFVPCRPPRFDTFGDKIIGKWDYLSPDAIVSSGVVEEVMRSCGGAVQGILELEAIGGGHGRDSLYLNRANDGFIFYDNGSYSLGPVNWTTDDNFFIASLMMGESRIAVWSKMNHEGENVNREVPNVL